MKRTFALATACALAALPPFAGAAPPTLSAHGGGLGETLTLEVGDAAGSLELLLFSPTFAPTPLPPPHVSPIDVGIEFLAVSVQALLAPVPPSGTLAYALPVPAQPVLDGVVVNFQALRVQGGVLTAKSNPYRVTLDTPGDFADTLHPMTTARAFGSASPLPDGTVLLAGGGSGSLTQTTGLKAAERYLPHLEDFAALPDMPHARALHTALALPDGRVLLVGGVDALGAPLSQVDVFDPQTLTFSTIGSVPTRVGQSATLLPDGRVLLAGGSTDPTDATTLATSATKDTFLFDPATGTATAGPALSVPRTFHSAAALPDGRVVLSGGLSFFTIFGLPVPYFADSVDLYVPQAPPGTGAVSSLAPLAVERAGHSSIALSDGRVLVAGGVRGNVLQPAATASCELVDPQGGAPLGAGNLSTARALPNLVLLEDGSVLAAGGAAGDLTNPVPVAAAERYTPQPGGAGSWQPVGPLKTARGGASALRLPDGTAVLFGGGGPGGAVLATCEVFQP